MNQFSKWLGVSPATITRAVKSGRIRETIVKMDGRWRILDPEATKGEFHRNTQRRPDIPEPQGPLHGGHPVSSMPTHEEAERPLTYDRARIQKLKADTRLQELKLQRMRGELVSVEEAAGVFADALSGLRSNLMALADRLALDLMAEDDQHTIRDMLRREFREVLTMASEAVARKRTQEEPEESQGAQDADGN